MTREEIIEYWRLENLRQGSLNNMFCPKCGSQLNIILNGFFHGQLFYCPHEKLIFNLDLKNITKSSSVEFLEYCNKENELTQIKSKINFKNMNKVKQLLGE